MVRLARRPGVSQVGLPPPSAPFTDPWALWLLASSFRETPKLGQVAATCLLIRC